MRLLLAVAVLLLGGVVGLASVAVHDWWPMLLLVAAALVAVLVALPRAWWSRLPFAVGYAAAVALGAVPRGEGDYLVGSDATGYALLGLTLVLVVVALATLPRRPLPDPSTTAERDREHPGKAPTDSLR